MRSYGAAEILKFLLCTKTPDQLLTSFAPKNPPPPQQSDPTSACPRGRFKSTIFD